MSENTKRVYALVKQDRLIVENCEDATVWSGSTDVSGIDTSTTHREGSQAITFDKDGTTQAYAVVSKTLDKQRDLSDYLRGKFRFWLSVSSLTNIASVSLFVGEDASNNYEYQIADTELTTGFQEIEFQVDTPTATNGTGAAWSSIGYVAVKITFDAAANTLTGIIFDSISVSYAPEIVIENLDLDATGLASATNQALILAAIQDQKQGDNSATDSFSFNDDSFVAGDSPVVHDINTALGGNANHVEFMNTGSGAILIEISHNGSDYKTQQTVPAGGTFSRDNYSVDSVRVTHSADTAYSLNAW